MCDKDWRWLGWRRVSFGIEVGRLVTRSIQDRKICNGNRMSKDANVTMDYVGSCLIVEVFTNRMML